MIKIAKICLTGLALALPCAAQAADIVVKATGVSPAKGNVIFTLFDETGYLKDPLQTIHVDAQNGEPEAVFENIEPGTYALGVIHDKNSNAKMDTNFLGIPKERGGFSNNAPIVFGPAKFKAAAFVLDAEPVTQVIALRKPK